MHWALESVICKQQKDILWTDGRGRRAGVIWYEHLQHVRQQLKGCLLTHYFLHCTDYGTLQQNVKNIKLCYQVCLCRATLTQLLLYSSASWEKRQKKEEGGKEANSVKPKLEFQGRQGNIFLVRSTYTYSTYGVCARSAVVCWIRAHNSDEGNKYSQNSCKHKLLVESQYFLLLECNKKCWQKNKHRMPFSLLTCSSKKVTIYTFNVHLSVR